MLFVSLYVVLPQHAYAGGRPGTKVCWDGGCSYKTAPGVLKRAETIKTALKAVFVEELQGHEQLQGFLDGTKAFQPSGLAGHEWAALVKENPKATSDDLVSYLRAKKTAILRDWGVTAFVDALDHPPVVTSFSPTTATTTDTITIYGSNLLPLKYVEFNGVLAYIDDPKENVIQVKVPKYINTIAGLPQAGMATTFKLVFRTRYETSFESSGVFQWLDGKCNDMRITQAYQEIFDRPARGSGTSGECNPANYGSFTSVADLMVQLAARTGEVAKRGPPQISYFEPWKAQPGTTIKINGLDLVQVKEVWFGSVKSPTFSSQSEYTMKAVVPEGGSGKVRVVTYSGSGESDHEFEVTTPPVIESVTPKEVLKGERIFIHGKNFNARLGGMVNGVYSLVFDSITPTDIVIRTDNISEEQNATLTISTDGGATSTTISIWEGLCDDTSLTGAFDDLYARRPLGGRMAGQCDPNLYGGTWPSMEALYSRIKALHGPASNARIPVISGLSPSTGAPGGLVMIDGANFINKTVSVSFNGVASREIIWRGTKQVQTRIPDGATSGPLVLRTINGSASATFTVNEGLTISRITPDRGVAGARLRLHGTGFDYANVTIGEQAAESIVASSKEIEVIVPKGVSGNVDITVNRPDGFSATWTGFPIYQINLKLPSGSSSLQDTRVELVAPDGHVVGTTHLIGNAGASFSDDQISALISNAGASLIGNAGASLIGNAGASFDAQGITGLIGNAGAGFKADLSRLIGNAGAGLAGNFGSGLAGNNGSGLAGNFGSGLAGNNGSGLAGNNGSGLAGNFGSGLAGNNGSGLTIALLDGRYGSGFGGEVMISGAAHNIGSRSVQSISRYGEVVPSAAEQRFVATLEPEPIVASAEVVETPPAEVRPTKERATTIEVVPTQTQTSSPSATSAVQEVTSQAPAEEASVVQETTVQPTTQETVPAAETSTETPDASSTPETEEETPQISTNCSTGFTYSPTLQICIEDAPEETSPYAGLPCNDNIPLYQQRGCISQ